MKLIKKDGLYVISEARKNPDMNPKISAYDALRKYKDDSDIYITFTEINKVGIFPMSGFNTPNGIYTYPLQQIWKEYRIDQKRSISQAVPFAGDRPHIQVLRLKNKKGFVDDMYKDYTSSDYDKDIEKIRELFSTITDDVQQTFDFFKKDVKIPTDRTVGRKVKVKRVGVPNENEDEKLLSLSEYESYKDTMFNQIDKLIASKFFKNNKDLYEFILGYTSIYKNFHWKNSIKNSVDIIKQKFGYSNISIEGVINFATQTAKFKSPIGIFWSITMRLSQDGSTSQILGSHSDTQKWNNLLRKLGYSGFADKSGRGIIHPSEPMQAVFLQKDVLQHLETVLNKDYNPYYDSAKNAMNKFKNNKRVANFYINFTEVNGTEYEFEYNGVTFAILIMSMGDIKIFDKKGNVLLHKVDALKDVDEKWLMKYLDFFIK